MVDDLEYQVKLLEEKGEWDNRAPNVTVVSLTNTACGQSITLTFNSSFTWQEILQVCAGTFFELCNPCP